MRAGLWETAERKEDLFLEGKPSPDKNKKGWEQAETLKIICEIVRHCAKTCTHEITEETNINTQTLPTPWLGTAVRGVHSCLTPDIFGSHSALWLQDGIFRGHSAAPASGLLPTERCPWLSGFNEPS